MSDSLGDRMKSYERCADVVLTPRMPVIVRVDGKAFHTWTRGMDRPFDENLIGWMTEAARALCSEVQTVQFAYLQSDEISLLLHGYKKITSEPAFGNRLQKLCSITASIAAAMLTSMSGRTAYFDARAFAIPEGEVANYFLWRQNDATRNSVQMLARSLASHKECHGKSNEQLQELCFQRGQNWNDLPTRLRRGWCVVREVYELEEGAIRSRWVADDDIPRFSGEGRNYVERFMALAEDEQ